MPESFNASSYLVDRHVAAGRGDRLALTGPDTSLTYAELGDLVTRVAAGLRGLNVRPEERVVLVMADGPRLLAAILGAMRIGAVAVPVSTMLTGTELAALVRDARARVMVTSEQFLAEARTAAAGAPEVTELVVDGHADLAAPLARTRVRDWDWKDLLAAGVGQSGEPYDTWDDSTALWLYTSGTTGTPKAAVHRHANIRHVVETYATSVLRTGPADRCYSVAKLFFAYGIGNSAFFPLAAGATTVLDPARPTPDSVAARLVEYRPTLFFAVPTFYAAMVNSGAPPEVFASVRLAVSAGEPMPAEVYRRFNRRFGVEILDGIGSTEALHIFLSNREGQVRPGSTGTPVPGYELSVRDEAGNEVGDDQPGSLFVRGESLALGYWARTSVTRRVFQGEWLRTGDTYLRSADGYYTCLGRSDDMMKVGGIWVSPTEVEARLLEHPGVGQAAVVGMPDADGLDKPVACVVPAAGPGDPVGAEELVAFCRAGLAAFKRPRQVLFFDELPTTATGKLRRFAVRDLAAQRLAGQTHRPDGSGRPGDPGEPEPESVPV
ncbi:MAG TPA: benzoate-CoA ligase family protein [Mycobacteriales bacterium]|nr:benzoate-CoA ligase family protein [Mycobacteriales bacterium]